jgi:hypothetical protein
MAMKIKTIENSKAPGFMQKQNEKKKTFSAARCNKMKESKMR